MTLVNSGMTAFNMDRNGQNNPLQNLANTGMPNQLLQMNQHNQPISSPSLPNNSTSPLNFNIPSSSTYSFPNVTPPFTLPSSSQPAPLSNDQNQNDNGNGQQQPGSEHNGHLFS